jgi:hypothetical protein
VRVYLGCERDHVPPLDASSAGVRATIARGGCPVCPEERLEVPGGDEAAGWGTCGCCGSGWKLEAEEGFACRPGRLVEEWE